MWDANRTAKRCSVAIVLVFGLAQSGAILKERRRVEVAVGEELVNFSMKVVGATVGDKVHDRSGDVSGGSIVTGGQDAELTDRELRRLEGDQRRPIRGEGVGNTVDGRLIRVELIAIRNELGRCTVERGLACAEIGRVHDPRGKEDHLRGVACLKRKFLNAFGVDHLSQ